MPKAYSYLRFSTPAQAGGDSRRRQLQAAQLYAQQHGLELDTSLSFEDLGVSAFKGRNAATGALKAFLRAVEDDIIPEGSYLLVENLDRISRTDVLDAQALFIQIVNAGIVLVTLMDAKVYERKAINANPMDLMMSLLLLWRANDESRTKALRIKQVWDNKRKLALEGRLKTPNRLPSWLLRDQDDILIDADKASTIKLIFKMFLEGMGRERIARSLTDQGIPTLAGNHRWDPVSVRHILRHPSVAGTLVMKELRDGVRVTVEEVPDFYPPVIPMSDFMAAQSLLESRAPSRSAAPGVNIIGGIGVCPNCGGRVGLYTKKPGWRYLRCRTARTTTLCDRLSVRYEPIEEALIESFPKLLIEMPSGDPDIDGHLEKLDTEILGLEAQQELLIAEVTGVRALRRAIADLQVRIEALRNERSELMLQSSLARMVEQRIHELTVAVGDRNILMRQLFASAIVHPNVIELVWRHRPDVSTEVLFRMPPI